MSNVECKALDVQRLNYRVCVRYNLTTQRNYCFFQDWLCCEAAQQPSLPDDHSESVPPLPIPNRTVKRLYADDSADSRVKVGNRQAP